MNPLNAAGRGDQAAPAPASVVRRGAARPAPARNPALAHLSLGSLRDYRSTLTAEEGRVSYWRRVVQARVDVVRSVDDGVAVVDNLRDVLVGVPAQSSRTALAALVSTEDMPPLPDVTELWLRQPVAEDRAANAELVLALEEAERRLSEYRAAVVRRLDAATAELIARYREDPSACLVALPLQRTRPLDG